MSAGLRICEYRDCDVDLDEAHKRSNAKFCGTDHKDAEHNARKHDPPGTTYPIGKPCQTAYSPPKRRNRRGSGSSLYLLGKEARYVRASLRGGKRPRLAPGERRRLLAKADRVAERLAA